MKRFERKAQSQPKHGPPSVSSASKATVLPKARPEWSGSGHTKKVTRRSAHQSQSATTPTATVHEHMLPFQLQQLMLDIIRTTFPASNEFDTLKPALREIKDALDAYDFSKAFANEESLEAYTIRWSPSRALAYANVLAWVFQDITEVGSWTDCLANSVSSTPAKAICFGHGAAEFMALAALIKHSQLGKADENADPSAASESNTMSMNAATHLNITIADDAADWSNVITKLHTSLTTPPTLSAYASAKARASNTAALSTENMKWTAIQADILTYGTQQLDEMIGSEPALLTLFFTLSELYSRSIPKTTKFLMNLTVSAPKDSFLLVIDHIGASVTKSMAKSADEHQEDKAYPLHWLLSQTLLPRVQPTGKEEDKTSQVPQWNKVVEDPNRIFKLPPGLRFPGSLENVKFQVHLFRRI